MADSSNEFDLSTNMSERRLLDDIEAQTGHQRIESEAFTSEFSEKPIKKRSTRFLDGLRGLAALCVFTQHFMGSEGHGFGENGNYFFIDLPFITVFWSGGAAAVAVFFVLSGFVLSQTSFKLFQKGMKQNCKQSLLSALVRRPIRLFIPCWAVAFVIAMLMHVPYNIYPRLPWSAGQENVWAEIVHWFVQSISYFQPFQRHGWVYGKYEYITPTWTIPIEYKGSVLVYGLCAICCFGIVSEVWSVVFLLGLSVLFLQFAWWWCGCFSAGVALSILDLYDLDNKYIFHRFSKFSKTAFIHTMLVLGWYLLSQPVADGRPETSLNTPGWHTLTLLIPSEYTGDDYYRFWQAYGAILIVWCTLRLNWVQFIFGTRPLQYLGKVSFMLYLVHLPLMLCVGDRFVRLFGQIQLGSGEKWWDNKLYTPDIGPRGLSLRWDIDWVLMLLITLGVSHVATRFIDEPCVKLGKILSDKIGLS